MHLPRSYQLDHCEQSTVCGRQTAMLVDLQHHRLQTVILPNVIRILTQVLNFNQHTLLKPYKNVNYLIKITE